MINSGSDLKQTDGAEIPNDSPPAYSTFSAEATTAPAPSIPANIKPTNFLSLDRVNDPITGIYVVDPYMGIPQLMLPPLAAGETEETRRNLVLHTRNGTINVTLFVLGVLDRGPDKKKAKMAIKVRAPAPCAHQSTSRRSPPTAPSGCLHLSRSFRGHVTICTLNGSIRLAYDLAAHTTTFSEVRSSRQCFVGDLPHDEGWTGDQIRVESTNGNVDLGYEMEGILGSHGGSERGLDSFIKSDADGKAPTFQMDPMGNISGGTGGPGGPGLEVGGMGGLGLGPQIIFHYPW
ncbi:hypothetical protein B0H13DRAFT_1851911 [Mycena leptocephala]|nr:hypothetical protein B0H13DRAFT_1851911 [Mycena leptocephala]